MDPQYLEHLMFHSVQQFLVLHLFRWVPDCRLYLEARLFLKALDCQ
jgi:hypothetical protein